MLLPRACLLSVTKLLISSSGATRAESRTIDVVDVSGDFPKRTLESRATSRAKRRPTMSPSFAAELRCIACVAVLADAHRDHMFVVGAPGEANLSVGLRYHIRRRRTFRYQRKERVGYRHGQRDCFRGNRLRPFTVPVRGGAINLNVFQDRGDEW